MEHLPGHTVPFCAFGEASSLIGGRGILRRQRLFSWLCWALGGRQGEGFEGPGPGSDPENSGSARRKGEDDEGTVQETQA